MRAYSGRSAWRGALAGTVLAGLAWSLVAPALSAGGHELHHCMPADRVAGTPVLQAGPHGDCGHMDLGTCEAALACTSLPSVALMGQGAVPAETPPFSRAVVLPVASAADLFRGGPPTPPPNS